MHLRSSSIGGLTGGLGLMALLSLCAPLAVAQVDLSQWPQVKAEILAVDKDGRPVAGVTADSLVAYAGGKPRPVAELTPTVEPQSVCVLIDASDSVGDGLALVRTKARRLLTRMPAEDEICVASFTNKLLILQSFTGSRSAEVAAVEEIAPAGGTQLRDALLELSTYMRGSAQHRSRVILLLSDGVDQHSVASQDVLRRGMETPGSPVVHMICLPQAFGHAARKQVDPRQNTAFTITGFGGGMTYFPHTMADLNGLIEALPLAMRSRYLLTFTAQNPAANGHEEQIHISLNKAHRNEGTEILAPEGYYAPSQ